MIPRWFAGLLLAATGGVVGAGLIGLVLAAFDVWSTPVAAASAIAGAAAGAAVAWRIAPGGGSTIAAAATVAVAVAFVGINWEVVGESVVLERDPGLYLNTARWIERDGGLTVDARVGPFGDAADDLEFVSVGMYDLDDSTLEFQSNHLTPTLFALGYGLAGVGGLTHVSLLLVAAGLLAVHAVSIRVTRRDWAGPVVVAALAASMPVLSVARDTLTEPVLLLLLWTAMWLWTVAADEDDRLAAVSAGVCLGACMATRIDAAVLLVPVPLVLLSWRRLARPLVAGIVPGVAVAALDVGLRSRGYLGDLDMEVALAYGLLAVSVVVALVASRVRLPRIDWPRVGDVLAGVTVVALLFAWFVRPHVQRALDDDSLLVRTIQADERVEIDGRRRYHELTMVWQSWYLGPVVVAAAVGGAAVVIRRLARATDPPLLLPMAVVGAGTALYLFRPSIAPDQIWAMRRFVPAGLPLLCLLAAVVLAAGLDRLRTHGQRLAAGSVAVVAALVPIGLRIEPVPAFREQDGFLRLVERTCDVVGADAAVVMNELGPPGTTSVGQTLAQTLRSWCGVPVALLPDGATGSTVEELAGAWADDGRTLWVVANTTDELDELPTDGDVFELGPVSSDRFLEDTLEHPPDDYREFPFNAVASRAAGA